MKISVNYLTQEGRGYSSIDSLKEISIWNCENFVDTTQILANEYVTFDKMKKVTDEQYGEGAAEHIAKAIKGFNNCYIVLYLFIIVDKGKIRERKSGNNL